MPLFVIFDVCHVINLRFACYRNLLEKIQLVKIQLVKKSIFWIFVRSKILLLWTIIYPGDVCRSRCHRRGPKFNSGFLSQLHLISADSRICYSYNKTQCKMKLSLIGTVGWLVSWSQGNWYWQLFSLVTLSFFYWFWWKWT